LTIWKCGAITWVDDMVDSHRYCTASPIAVPLEELALVELVVEALDVVEPVVEVLEHEPSPEPHAAQVEPSRRPHSVSSITRCSSPRPLLIPLMRASCW
jgi:hypothetical protein